MLGGIDPKKIQSMMKQMGINQEDIEASKVIIEKSEGGRIIIDNPTVTKIKMNGNENFQVSGDISEESSEEKEDENKLDSDIQTIAEQTGADKEIIAIELEKNNGDIAETIISLNNQSKNSKQKKK